MSSIGGRPAAVWRVQSQLQRREWHCGCGSSLQTLQEQHSRLELAAAAWAHLGAGRWRCTA